MFGRCRHVTCLGLSLAGVAEGKGERERGRDAADVVDGGEDDDHDDDDDDGDDDDDDDWKWDLRAHLKLLLSK